MIVKLLSSHGRETNLQRYCEKKNNSISFVFICSFIRIYFSVVARMRFGCFCRSYDDDDDNGGDGCHYHTRNYHFFRRLCRRCVFFCSALSHFMCFVFCFFVMRERVEYFCCISSHAATKRVQPHKRDQMMPKTTTRVTTTRHRVQTGWCKM